jgi:hypothetical protein
MSGTTMILIVVVILALAIAGWAMMQRQKTLRLRNRYGPEYDRLAEREQSARRAEGVLEQREKRVSKFRIQPLQRDERARLVSEWREVQERFVDDPRGAVAAADRLISEALQARGYPMADFEQQAADLSVQYPHVVENYRRAHRIAIEEKQGSASTEDLRKAMQYYRSLFEDVSDTKITRAEPIEEVRHG